MAEKTDEYNFDRELIGYYKEKVQQLEEARRFLSEYERKKRSGNYTIGETGRIESEEDFNEILDDLMFFAYPKVKKSTNIELPDSLKTDIPDGLYTCDGLDMQQKKRLLYKFRDLFEALNITSLEREKWETEGIGAVDKEEDAS